MSLLRAKTAAKTNRQRFTIALPGAATAEWAFSLKKMPHCTGNWLAHMNCGTDLKRQRTTATPPAAYWVLHFVLTASSFSSDTKCALPQTISSAVPSAKGFVSRQNHDFSEIPTRME